MNPNIEYRVNHTTKLIRYEIKGKVTLNDIFKNIKSTLSSPDYSDKYNILIEPRGVEFIDFLENIDDFVQFVGEFSQTINMRRKCAILAELPKNNAFAVYLIRKLDTLRTGMYLKAFATESLALDWLSIS